MRYILDERVGCAAVIDTHHPDYDPEYPGLHSDTGGVVLYEAFTNKFNLNVSEYEIEEGRLVIERLKKDCKTLNDTAPRTKTEFVKVNYGMEHFAAGGDLFSGRDLHVLSRDGNYYKIKRQDKAVEASQDGRIYEKVEAEIDERQEFIEAAKEIIDGSKAAEYSLGAMFDSGRFKLVE
ncbi:hypothetical protein VPHK46_0029 [Vibrio phage K46]|nr:hypothetical protein SIPHO078v2_p0022 [Vibrio phage 14E30.1]